MTEQQHHAENISRDPGLFARVARRLTHLTGSPRAIVGVVAALVIWIAVGWWLGFPRAWELAATAGLPVLTLVLLIVVQHTQNHDDRAIQLKLDELIRALDQASDSMIQVDQGSWKDLEKVRENQAEDVRRRATER